MKIMTELLKRNKGFILLPIILTLAVLAAIALMISREAAINAGNVIREHQPETISYVGAAGLAIGEKELKQDTDCSAYTVTGSSVFNGKNYTSSITPNNGSPVTLKVDVDQGGGVSRQFVRQVKMYDSTPTGQVLNPSQDVHSRFSNSTTNYNSGAEANRLHVNYSILLLPDRISYLQFDLSGVTTPVEEIQSVTLELHSGGTPESNSVSVGVNRIKNDWLEDQVTYNQRKTSVNWQPSDIDWAASAQTVVNENVVGWKTWDVTDLVKGWLTGAYPNYGMALFGQVGNTNNLEFISQNDPDTSKRPILRIMSPCECGHGSSGSATLQPGAEGKDTFLNSFGSRSVSSYGGDSVITVAESSAKNGLLQFDLTGIPAGAVITSAALDIYAESSANAGSILSAYRLIQGWLEGTTSAPSASTDGASWDKYDAVNSWSTAGGDYNLTPVSQTTMAATVGWYSLNLTAPVAGWVDGTIPNFGLLLRAGSGFGSASFTSSDSADAIHRPKLTINYTCPCGVACTYTPPLPPPSSPQTLTPIADTYLYQNNKNTNFGTSTILYLGTDTSGKKDQGLIQFDISTIPAGATITSAKLRLYKTTAGGSGTVNIGAYKLTTSWGETSATWNNMAGSSNYAATQLAQTTLPLSSTGWVEWNLSTTVITEWLGGTPNYGLALVYEGVNNAYGVFSSRESTTNKPELVIDYTTP